MWAHWPDNESTSGTPKLGQHCRPYTGSQKIGHCAPLSSYLLQEKKEWEIHLGHILAKIMHYEWIIKNLSMEAVWSINETIVFSTGIRFWFFLTQQQVWLEQESYWCNILIHQKKKNTNIGHSVSVKILIDPLFLCHFKTHIRLEVVSDM